MVNFHSMEWHEGCLKNLKSFLKSETEDFNRRKEALNRLEENVRIYSAQISRAKKLNRVGFDRDLFKE